MDGTAESAGELPTADETSSYSFYREAQALKHSPPAALYGRLPRSSGNRQSRLDGCRYVYKVCVKQTNSLLGPTVLSYLFQYHSSLCTWIKSICHGPI